MANQKPYASLRESRDHLRDTLEKIAANERAIIHDDARYQALRSQRNLFASEKTRAYFRKWCSWRFKVHPEYERLADRLDNWLDTVRRADELVAESYGQGSSKYVVASVNLTEYTVNTEITQTDDKSEAVAVRAEEGWTSIVYRRTSEGYVRMRLPKAGDRQRQERTSQTATVVDIVIKEPHT